MGPGITDDSFETLAFLVCNSDGVERLSWAEVEQCQVSKNKYDNVGICSSKFFKLRSLSLIFLPIRIILYKTLCSETKHLRSH